MRLKDVDKSESDISQSVKSNVEYIQSWNEYFLNGEGKGTNDADIFVIIFKSIKGLIASNFVKLLKDTDDQEDYYKMVKCLLDLLSEDIIDDLRSYMNSINEQQEESA